MAFTRVTPTSKDFRADALRAEAERRAALLQTEVNGALRRLGVQPGPGNRVDVHHLDKVMAAAGMTTQARIALKHQMASLGMVD
jgi:hypothetical protein